jgi:hypothetical protein
MSNFRHLLSMRFQSWCPNLRLNTIHWVKVFYLHLSFQSHQFAAVCAHPQHSTCTVRWRISHQPRYNSTDRPTATKLFCRPGAGEFFVLLLRNSVEVGGREGRGMLWWGGGEWDRLETRSVSWGTQAACRHSSQPHPTNPANRCVAHCGILLPF